jgi:hypothetical protein
LPPSPGRRRDGDEVSHKNCQSSDFFNPRKDNWGAHFEIEKGAIFGKTEIGKATVNIFKFNEIDRLIFRNQLADLELYP